MLFARSPLPCLAIGLLLLSSCAEEKSAIPSGTREKAEAYLTPAKDLSEAISIAKSAVVRCAEGATCSPSVGLLSFALTEHAAQCTATLVAADIVATNAHCVPPELRKEGASCRGRIWMNFAKNENASFETQIGCDQVLISEGGVGDSITESPQGGDLADYAFLKLAKPSARPALRVSREGIKDGEILRLEKVDPVQGEGATGIQHEVSCVAVQHSMLADFNSDRDSVPLLAECEVRKGNSGSALRASDGTIRGVVYGVMNTKTVPEAFEQKGLSINGPIGPFSLGSNFACLKIPAALNAGEPAAACSGAPAKNFSLRDLNGKTNEILNQIVQANFASHEGFRWFDFRVDRPSAREMVLAPKCVMANQAKLNQEATMGDLHLAFDGKVDSYLRYESATLKAKNGAPSKAKLTKRDDGTFSAEIDGTTLLLEACPAAR